MPSLALAIVAKKDRVSPPKLCIPPDLKSALELLFFLEEQRTGVFSPSPSWFLAEAFASQQHRIFKAAPTLQHFLHTLLGPSYSGAHSISTYYVTCVIALVLKTVGDWGSLRTDLKMTTMTTMYENLQPTSRLENRKCSHVSRLPGPPEMVNGDNGRHLQLWRRTVMSRCDWCLMHWGIRNRTAYLKCTEEWIVRTMGKIRGSVGTVDIVLEKGPAILSILQKQGAKLGKIVEYLRLE